jgi:hypothetical protein
VKLVCKQKTENAVHPRCEHATVRGGRSQSDDASSSSVQSECERKSGLKVWSAADVGIDHPSGPLEAVWQWVQSYVLEPHIELGRSGVVCPFVSTSLLRRRLFISLDERAVADEKEMCEILSSYLRIYKSLQPTVDDEFKALIVAFPALDPASSESLITGVHRTMKPDIVSDGLMLGEFYPKSESPGVHNPKFYPLRSPMPLFVIRQMVETDWLFLNRESDPPLLRIQFISSYLRALGDRLPAAYAEKAQIALAMLRESRP